MKDTLAKFFGMKQLEFRLVPPHRFVHCVIDVQKHYCDPLFSTFGTRQTDTIARRIAGATSDFRAAAMPVCMIYKQRWNEPPEQAFGGFHRVQPQEGDMLVGKTQYSAFEYTDLAETFRQRGFDTLLISGFDIECCVNATVQDALRENFNVWVLSDCIGNGGKASDKSAYIKLMRDNGAELITLKQARLRLSGLYPT